MIIKPPIFIKPIHGHPLGPAGGLVAGYVMNEGSGSIVQDLSGNGNVGTNNGGEWIAGKFGPALNLVDTNSDYIDMGGAIVQGVPMSVSFWFKMNTLPEVGAFYTLFAIGDVGAASDILRVFYRPIDNNYLVAQQYDGVSSGAAAENVALSAGVWYHVVAVFATDNSRLLYRNGVLVATNTNAVDALITQDYTQVGRLDWDGGPIQYADCVFDNISVYNRALSASEITLLYREPFCMFDRDPIELWSAATLGAPPVGNAGIMTCNTGFWGATY